MLRACILQFGGSWEDYLPLCEFAYNNSYQASIGMPPYEALYGRPCRSPACWAEPEDTVTIGPEIVVDHTEKIRQIRQRLRAAQDRQKKYADRYHDSLSYEVGDMVYLKVSPWKGRRGLGLREAAPRFIGPYRVVAKVGSVAYRLDLPAELAGIHPTFHISMLRLARTGPRPMVDVRQVDVQPDATYEERPLAILDRKIRTLRTREIAKVLVRWRITVRRDLRELESTMRERYPQLFHGMF
ncbi:hypothetical protein Sjap_017994 [Stephania japonica]|uniref:Tf2-1-like SH3-like domain-containing protein n=1 Tax=Stephania japonica TaxID=461633 RepID=A0AAP0I769_9MAGN